MTLAAAHSGERFGPGFVRPDYGGRCFSGIPESIARLLGCDPAKLDVLPLNEVISGGAAPAKNVVLILVDGFGWKFLERYQNLNAVKQVLNGARAECLTSQFPSTTTAHLSALHSGVPVTESGIYEWFYHEPIAGRLIAPLLFNDARSCVAGEFSERENLCKLGITAEQISPWPSHYQNLHERSAIESFVYHSASFANEKSAIYTARGATVLPVDCIEHGFSLLTKHLQSRTIKSARSYHMLYLPEFDGMTHEYGPASCKLVPCAERIFEQIASLKTKLPADTIMLITADHGQTHVDPKTTFFLDRLFPEITSAITLGASGLPLVPAGSARDFFLHIIPGRELEIIEKLRKKLRGIAEVYSRDEMQALGLLGKVGHAPSARFLERVGDVVVLPHPGHTVWWSENGKFKMSFLGHHGGLTEDEMLIPLISFRS